MTVTMLRSIERIHGVVAWAATLALVASASLCARSGPGRSPGTRRAARLAGVTAVGLALAAGALGLALHDPYRARLRQRLFLESLELGWLFERKQNIAFAAVLLGVSAFAALVQLGRVAPGAPDARDLWRSATLAWAGAALLALAASIASVIVARHSHF